LFTCTTRCGFVSGAHAVVNGRMQYTRPRLGLVFSTAVVAMFLDVITKVIAVGVLVPGGRVPLIGDHVGCALTRNAGAAFSWGGAYTVELAVLVGGIITVLAWRSRHVVSTAAAIAIGLVLGGAAGNLADRVFRSPGPFARRGGRLRRDRLGPNLQRRRRLRRGRGGDSDVAAAGGKTQSGTRVAPAVLLYICQLGWPDG
jgi:lipoprotein signal peptidase